MEKHKNTIEYEVSVPYSLFSDPILRVGGEKTSYMIPTYEAIKGITESCYWKPSIYWVVDAIRVMNPIFTETKDILLKKMGGGSDLAYYTYLADVRYQVRAHLEMNLNYPELKKDQIDGKHYNIAKRMVERGGRRDIYLGTKECQGFIEPCVFGEGKSYYDSMTEAQDFGFMYHGMTYPNEAILPEDKNMLTTRFWNAVMKKGGIIEFPRPEACEQKRRIRPMEPTKFGSKYNNFSGLQEFADEGEK